MGRTEETVVGWLCRKLRRVTNPEGFRSTQTSAKSAFLEGHGHYLACSFIIPDISFPPIGIFRLLTKISMLTTEFKEVHRLVTTEVLNYPSLDDTYSLEMWKITNK